MRFLLTSLLLGIWAGPAAYSEVPCGVGTAMCWMGNPDFPRQGLEIDDATGEFDCHAGFWNDTGTVSFNLTEGRLSVLADAATPTLGGLTVQGVVTDTYALVGHSHPAAVHDFQAVITVKLSRTMDAFVRQGFRAAAPTDTIRCRVSGCDTTAVVYNLSKRVGEPFSFTLGMKGWDNWIHVSHGTMTISFTGLEDGLQVGSCHGYHGLTAPVASTTWGRIKARYR